MKLICLLFFSVLIADQALALPNPAAVYCQKLGYEYKKIQTTGGEKGIVIIAPGVQFDAWDFFRGKVGKEYSFGALCGYDTACVRANIGTYVAEYAVCIPKGAKGLKTGERIALTDLMDQKGMPLFDERENEGKKTSGDLNVPANREEDMLRIYERMDGGKMLPAAFDWRANNSHAYIGSIRDQGSCGSCYAFAAAASAEGTYNWAMGRYDGSCIDFSESFIIWCLGRLPQYTNNFFGCRGANYDYAELTALTAEGICLEADFPYTESDPGTCEHWSDPVAVFSSWHRILCGEIDAIKTAIMTYGVVDAAVYADSNFQSYSTGIFTNTSTSCYSTPCYYTPVNHAIALVGWDDNPPEGGGGCWILRNSWGTDWGENGYMRIRYNAARVACEACYLIYLGTNTHTLNVTSPYGGAYPAVGITTHNSGVSITCYITNSTVIDGTTQFACRGWSGAGSVPAAGNGTNTGSFALNSDSAIVWQWQTNFYLNIDTNGCGSVDTVSGWQALGSNVVVTATPVSLYRFVYWSGDTGNCTIVSNRITITMNRARAITAHFIMESLSAPTGVSASDGTYTDKVCITWNTVTDATGYQVWCAGENNVRAAGNLGNAIVSSFDDNSSAVRLATMRYYWVKAWNNIATSEFSNVDSGFCRLSESAEVISGQPVVGDYDGDGKADPAVYDLARGRLFAWLSSARYVLVTPVMTFQVSARDLPVTGDFDGDALADPGVFERATGSWYFWLSSAGYSRVGPVMFGLNANDIPIPADYDGDMKADPAVYHANTGEWNIWLSGAGYVKTGPFLFQLSFADIPVPGQFDVGLLADPAVYQSASGAWYVWLSSAGYLPIGPVTFSTADDHIAVPADYDGDRLTDPASYVPALATWRIWMSGNGYTLIEPKLK